MLVATWMASRAAEHAYAADRFAREIVGFLKLVGGALAAADRQPVRHPWQRDRRSLFDLDQANCDS